MHDGDMSAGFDETVIAEKSRAHDVRRGSEGGWSQGHTCV